MLWYKRTRRRIGHRNVARIGATVRMDWLSFTLGFLAFPLLGILAFGVATLARRLTGRQAALADLSQRGSTLSFSSRLIGEIGEEIDSGAGPRAKAS